MKLCDRCRISGCCLNYLGDACKRVRERECPDVVFTNGDRIRSMSDEELAKEFVAAGEFENRVCFCCEYFKSLQNKDGYCVYKHGRCNMDARLEAYKKWLQQPAEEK